MPTPEQSESLSGRFLAMLRPARSRQRPADYKPVEDEQYVLMLLRMIRALEARAIERPEIVPLVLVAAQRLDEITNVVIATSADRYKINPAWSPSMSEIARVLGISVPAASQRRKNGNEIINRRLAAAGATRFAEANREKQAVEAATEHAVTYLGDYKARHAAA